MKRFLTTIVFCLIFLATPLRAHAHSASTAYLRLLPRDATVAVQLSVALRDLDYAVGLDTNGDGRITWGEVRARETAIDAYALSHLAIAADGAGCPPGPVTHLTDQLSDGAYAVLQFNAACSGKPHRLRIDYSLLFDQDTLHRGLINIVTSNGANHAGVVSPTTRSLSLDLSASEGGAAFFDTVESFCVTGIDHLLTGIDHMLFITMLLIPAVFVRKRGADGRETQVAANNFRTVFVESLKVLSAFTLAHATTLTLSVLRIVYIPERLSESGIALTIVLTALDNIFHFMPARRWPLAFAFGLVHGLGFASALGPLDLPPVALGVALVAFNLGLEMAQITIAAVVLPLGFALRQTLFYPRRVVPGISAAVGLLALAWFTDRAAGLGLMPF